VQNKQCSDLIRTIVDLYLMPLHFLVVLWCYSLPTHFSDHILLWISNA